MIKQHTAMLLNCVCVCIRNDWEEGDTHGDTLKRMAQRYTISVEFGVEASPSLTPGLMWLGSQGGR